MAILQILNHSDFTFNGFTAWSADITITPATNQMVLAFGIVINPSNLPTLSTLNLSLDNGSPGYTSTVNNYAGMTYIPAYQDAHVDNNGQTIEVYVAGTTGMLRDGSTKIFLSNQGSDTVRRVGAIIVDSVNSAEWFGVVPPVAFIDMANAGALPASTTETTAISATWYSFLAGIGAFDDDPVNALLAASVYRLGPDNPDTGDSSGSGGFGAGYMSGLSGSPTMTYPMVDILGAGTSSPAHGWVFNGDAGSASGLQADSWWAGTAQYVAIFNDPDVIPYPTPGEGPEGEGIDNAPKLHIPHKEYAMPGQLGNILHKYTANWTAIEQWANLLRCSGVTDNGDGTTTTLTPFDADWKETRLHIPHKTTLTPRHVNENYLAFERWARLICPRCHIPHKEWLGTYQNPQQELTNLLTIERWANNIGRCCVQVVEGNPEEL